MVFFDDMLPDESLEKFLDREVRPDTDFLSDCNQIIDTVVRLIHRHPKYSVNQVIKGGSLGKGTAIRGHSDVDLLVVLNNFKNIKHLKENMENVLYDFRDYLKSAVEREGNNIEIRIMGQTPFTLQFDLRCSDDSPWFDVDLLPIVDVWSTWLLGFAGGVQSTYSKMELKPHLRKYYAKSLAKLQIEFVKPMPPKVKDLICLLKYWKYTEQVELTSYCIELLVIHMWRENGEPNNFTMKQLMTKVVALLVTFGESTIAFSDHYTPSDYIQELGRNRPYVLDPSNPYHDVASDPNMSTDCSRIESKGKQLQRKLEGLPEFSEESGCVVS
ncbi:2'-5'-oligoadenylate synthase 1-like isoform X2 [Mytilus californianus]|uniref:2'-5'-oligoadenylate synthase 1-like isoform X2 n=1 Tax=Mytilus californianus TaxID=6549 RepID=UPI002247C502|nr:2'-5'-oligoadenylate synthase 1-like isoform X2 [Mytilus californianus]